MTKREKKLLEIARQIIMMNEGCALTGSLLLTHLGLSKKREAHDIDIVFKGDFKEKPSKFTGVQNCQRMEISNFQLPKNFVQCTPIYITDDDTQYVSFVNDEGIVIDFLRSPEEIFVNYHHIPCGSVIRMVQAKEKYAKQPNSQAEKHKSDLENGI
jgi:hypothetical protein